MDLSSNIHVIEFDTLGSTNDYLKGLARNGYPEGTVVWAHEQTSGRGRHGNSWVSARGNLFASLLMRPDVNASITGQLSFLTAVAVARVIKRHLHDECAVQVKWPNDILINQKKCAGILLETELNGVAPVQWVVVGVGVNLCTAPENAACLKGCAKNDIDLRDFMMLILDEIYTSYTIWKKEGFASVRDEWLLLAAHLKESIRVRLAHETFDGMFCGIDSMGTLQLKMDDGSVRNITSGEVFLP